MVLQDGIFCSSHAALASRDSHNKEILGQVGVCDLPGHLWESGQRERRLVTDQSKMPSFTDKDTYGHLPHGAEGHHHGRLHEEAQRDDEDRDLHDGNFRLRRGQVYLGPCGGQCLRPLLPRDERFQDRIALGGAYAP